MDDFGRCLTARAATPSGLSRFASSCLHRIAIAGRWKFSAKAGRETSDPEKLVTPGVLYASKSEGRISVHLLAFGWWDWHISFLVARIRAASAIETRQGGDVQQAPSQRDESAVPNGETPKGYRHD